mgnify:CR=1 FL=1
MDVKEFAKYVIDNMSRASLANSLNIASKLDNPEYYKLLDFLNEVVLYVNDLLKENKMDTLRACRILVASDDCKKMYELDKPAIKTMIIDDYVMNIWRAFN